MTRYEIIGESPGGQTEILKTAYSKETAKEELKICEEVTPEADFHIREIG
jgi:hypothetical protein